MTAETTRPTMQCPFPPELLDRGTRPFDPPAALTLLDEQAPLSRVTLPGGADAWVVTGHEQARSVLADHRFSSDLVRRPSAVNPLPPAPEGPVEVPQGQDGRFIFMDPPAHTRLRRLLTGQFTVRRMQHLETRIREISVEHIEAMRAAGDEADLVQAFALPLPSLVICELLGVDYADRDEFQERTATAMSLTVTDEERTRATVEINEFMGRLVTRKREHPSDDLLSGLIHGDADPALTDTELTDMAIALLGAGHETTANMLSLGTFALLEHPDQWAAVLADPAVLVNGVDELLRYLSINHLGLLRIATEPVEVAGTTIEAGDTVFVSVARPNRAAGRWPEPDRLDLRRPRTAHLAFGFGVHQCLGQQLARAELRVGLAELVTRLPGLRLAVPAEQVPLRTDMLIFGVHSLPVAWN